MKDQQIQTALARVMIAGTLLAAGIITIGLIWFLVTHAGTLPGDRIYSGEPEYFKNPVTIVQHALQIHEIGHRRSLIMIGIVLLLINPIVRVGFAVFGFALQKDRLYTAVSLFVFAVLLFSFFW